MGMPADCPPILITQHMPPRFTAAFAERLNRECPMTVSEAEARRIVEPGHVYIAPGAHHLEIVRDGQSLRLSASRWAAGLRPSSVGRRAVPVRGARRRRKAIGVILTGMGKDGAEGMLEMRKAGALTLGQDEAVVAHLRHAARGVRARRASMQQHPLSQMAEAILDAC